MQFLDFSKLYTDYKGIDDAIKKELVCGKLILQEAVEVFESELAQYLGVKYVIGVNSGTDAILISLKVSGIGRGDEVITVSNTFIATIQVIVQLGAKPVLIDVGDDGLMDMEKFAYTFNLTKTKAVIPVHLSGAVANTEWLTQYDIPMIEDACQAMGAKGVGKGELQCYSFYPAKILGCFGDGGAIATNDKRLADRVRSLRNHGGVSKDIKKRYEYGYNSRLDNIQAAVLSVKLKRLNKDLAKRKKVADMYNNAFKELPIGLPYNTKGRVWQDYIIRTKDRDKLEKYLTKNDIQTLGAGMKPNHEHKGLGLECSLPKTEEIIATSLRLPCNQFLTEGYYKM